MKNIQDYYSWIRIKYPTKASAAYACEKASKDMAKDFPELRLVRGHVDIQGLGTDIEHWWCETEEGIVIDPTDHQWYGEIVSYTEYEGEEPTNKCYYCGEYVFPSKTTCTIFCHHHDNLDINKLLKE